MGKGLKLTLVFALVLVISFSVVSADFIWDIFGKGGITGQPVRNLEDGSFGEVAVVGGKRIGAHVIGRADEEGGGAVDDST